MNAAPGTEPRALASGRHAAWSRPLANARGSVLSSWFAQNRLFLWECHRLLCRTPPALFRSPHSPFSRYPVPKPMRALILFAAMAACACGPASQGGVPEYGYDVVHVYPQDRPAFTEGLFYLDGFLYEATGLEQHSSVRKLKLETGEVIQQHDLPPEFFGEGIIKWKDKLYKITYKTEVGLIYDFNTFAKKGEFHYPGQGWSFTTD